MAFVPESDIDRLSRAVTGRNVSVFDPALAELAAAAKETFAGARVLVTGAAGFIGGQTLRLVLDHAPSLVVLADTWENGLAETVRQLRTTGAVSPLTRLEPRLVDVTSPLMSRVIDAEGPFDVVLAFAAAKHVRSERDPASALHMLNVNVNGTLRVLTEAARHNPRCRLFMVSTDKAADPSSLMGASKRLMERAVLSNLPQATTTRFANVAFSSGSLLESWLIRLANEQVLAVPRDTSRFFVRPVEAGQLCLIAAVAPQGSIVVPASGLVTEVLLDEALERVLDAIGLRPHYVEDPQQATPDLARGTVTVLRTPRDTAGEKPAEVFVGDGERAIPWRTGLETITTGASANENISRAVGWITDVCHTGSLPTLSEIIEHVRAAVPEFHHVDSEKRLDDRI